LILARARLRWWCIDGSAAARASNVAALLRDKRPVLMIDAFQTGKARTAQD
jgi:hypothetical protein